MLSSVCPSLSSRHSSSYAVSVDDSSGSSSTLRRRFSPTLLLLPLLLSLSPLPDVFSAYSMDDEPSGPGPPLDFITSRPLWYMTSSPKSSYRRRSNSSVGWMGRDCCSTMSQLTSASPVLTYQHTSCSGQAPQDDLLHQRTKFLSKASHRIRRLTSPSTVHWFLCSCLYLLVAYCSHQAVTEGRLSATIIYQLVMPDPVRLV